jgi:hypothetical protein
MKAGRGVQIKTPSSVRGGQAPEKKVVVQVRVKHLEVLRSALDPRRNGGRRRRCFSFRSNRQVD